MTIQHDCVSGGCYVKNHTPDWSFLKGAFENPNISPSDMDGWVESHGHLLMLEWKHEGVEIPMGQRIAFENLTKRNDITVYVIFGNPRTSEPKHLTVFHNGKIISNTQCDRDRLYRQVGRWEGLVAKAHRNAA